MVLSEVEISPSMDLGTCPRLFVVPHDLGKTNGNCSVVNRYRGFVYTFLWIMTPSGRVFVHFWITFNFSATSVTTGSVFCRQDSSWGYTAFVHGLLFSFVKVKNP